MKVFCKKHETFYEDIEGCIYCDDLDTRETPVDMPNPYATATDEEIDDLLQGWFGGNQFLHTHD